jgi:hypothetical protein
VEEVVKNTQLTRNTPNEALSPVSAESRIIFKDLLLIARKAAMEPLPIILCESAHSNRYCI